MKKILMSVLVIVVVASVAAVGASGAWFSDKETSEGNTFTAGTIDLMMSVDGVASGSFSFTDIKPCEDLEPIVIKLKNVGQNNGYLYQKITYTEKDKPGDHESDAGNLSANAFAALIYVESIEFLLYIDGTPSSQGPRDDLPGMLTAMDSNGDGYVSLYEMKVFGWMPYSSDYPEDPGDPDDTLQVGHSATLNITFHMADSLVSYPDGDLVFGVEDNWPQADGIDLTWTALLKQTPGLPTP